MEQTKTAWPNSVATRVFSMSQQCIDDGRPVVYGLKRPPFYETTQARF